MSKRLEAEVWSLNNCSGCGLCVAVCSKQVLHWNGEDHPYLEMRPKTVGYTKATLDSCSYCQKFCEEACPRLERWSALDPKQVVAGRAKGPVKSGSPNDVIRAILAAGRSAGLIDGVLLLDLDPWTLKPMARVATTVEEIVDNLGPQYLWAPLFDQLNDAVYERQLENIAVVGMPCTAQAIRKLRESENARLKPYQDAIRLTISIFCTGIYRPQLLDDVLFQKMGIARDHVKHLEVSPDRELLQALLWDGSQHSISRTTAEEYTRPGCGTCDDYLGESADLAVGLLGAPTSSSTIIMRSRTGDIFIRNALQMNLLEVENTVDESALTSAASDKDRRERAQAFKELHILMLDSLADPLQRGEAVKQFVRLYRTPVPTHTQQKVTNACTGC